MVSSGTVSGDASSFSDVLDSYKSAVSGIGSSWEGESESNFTSKAEAFCGEFSAITNQMISFSEACASFEEYKAEKEAMEIAQENYSKAKSYRDSATLESDISVGNSDMAKFSKEIEEHKNKMKELKEKIKSSLESASSPKLEAQSTTIGSFNPTVGADAAGQPNSNNSSIVGNSFGNAIMTSLANYAVAVSGGGYDGSCEAWAEKTWETATGIQRQNQIGAYQAWENFGVSDSRDNIPVGAMVYGSGSGSDGAQYGHVGIYVGDGKVADQGGVKDLDSWLSWQTANCHGHTGWIGWGWQNNIDLSKQ